MILCHTFTSSFSPFVALRAAHRKESMTAMIVEGSKSAAVAFVGVMGFHYGAWKFWPRYQQFPRSPRIFWLSSLVVAAYWITAEKVHLEIQQRHFNEMIEKRENLDEQYRTRSTKTGGR